MTPWVHLFDRQATEVAAGSGTTQPAEVLDALARIVEGPSR